MALTGGNIANLNIMVNSNVTQAIGQLTILQRTLQQIRSGGAINLFGNISGQLNSINAATQSTTINLEQMRSGIGGIVTALAGMKIGQSLTNGMSTALTSAKAVGAAIVRLRTSLNTQGLSFGQSMFPTDPGLLRSSIGSTGVDVIHLSNAMYRLRQASNAAGASMLYLNNSMTPGSFSTAMSGFKLVSQYIMSAIRNVGFTDTLQNLKKSIKDGLKWPTMEDWGKGFSILGAGLQGIMQTMIKFGAIIATVVIAGLANLGAQALKTGIQFNIMMEQMRTGYSVMLQGVGNSIGYGMAQADKLIGKLKAFADVTPFTLPQVTQGANQLIGYGVGEGKANQVEQISAAVAMLGDVSRGIPEKFNDIAYAYGQISAMGRLQGQELRQLINAGWNPLLEISKSTGKSLATLKKEMEDGAISIDMVTEALITATSEGGRFYGMMEKQAGTVFGIWSTLKDKVTSSLGAITEGITENLKTILGYGVTIMNALQFKVPGYSLLTYLDYIAISISTNVIPELERLGKYILYVFNADTINGDMRPAIDGITESIGNGIRYVGMFGQWIVAVTNIIKVMFGVMYTGFNMMRAGIMTIWSLFKGLLLAVGSGLNVIVFGLGGIFEGLGRSIGGIAEKIGKTFANGFMKGGNAIIDFLNNNLGLGLSTWKPFETTGGWGIMDAFGKDNANWNLMLSNMETIKAGWSTIGDDWLKTMGTLNAEMIASSKEVAEAWKALTTEPDLSKVDKFLAALKAQGKTPKVPVVDKKSLLGNAVQDLTKTTEAANKLAESILNITDKLVNMGNVFEKMTYEKFSPYKLVVRMQRFFNEMSKWTVNLAQLQTQGVPAGMINQLQEMGIQGYGITKGLVNATDAQRKQIIDQYQASRGMAFGVAGQQAKYNEGIKEITVNVTGNSVVSPELVNILTDQIVKKLRLAGA